MISRGTPTGWQHLLLGAALLVTSCASLQTAPGHAKPPISAPRPLVQAPSDGRSRAPTSPPRNASAGDARQSPTLTHQAVVGAIREIESSTATAAGALLKLSASGTG